jgi:DNA-binding NtrC family response regulator
MNRFDPIKILIVDDDRRMTKTLADILTLNGFAVERASSAAEALEKIEQQNFDCVISDIKMPAMDGVELFHAIHTRKPELPVVLMTAYATNDLMDQAHQAGVVAALEKPLDINQILGFFSSLSHHSTIAIVDDDPNFCATLAGVLRMRNFKVIEIHNPEEILNQPLPEAQILLLDMKLNGVNGLDILQVIRAKQPNLPVVLMTGYREEMAVAIERAMQTKAYTCLYKPFEVDELLRVIANLRNRQLIQSLSSKRKD